LLRWCPALREKWTLSPHTDGLLWTKKLRSSCWLGIDKSMFPEKINNPVDQTFTSLCHVSCSLLKNINNTRFRQNKIEIYNTILDFFFIWRWNKTGPNKRERNTCKNRKEIHRVDGCRWQICCWFPWKRKSVSLCSGFDECGMCNMYFSCRSTVTVCHTVSNYWIRNLSQCNLILSLDRPIG
jgi:hypothetical protein